MGNPNSLFWELFMSEIPDPVVLRPLVVDEDQSQRISGPDRPETSDL